MSNPTNTNQASEVLQGDCLELMKDIPDGSVDMILADLPYGTTQNKWDSIIPFEPLWEQYERVIKKNGAIVLTAQTPFDKTLGSSNIKRLRYELIWEKNRPSGFLNANKMPLKSHENILVFYKSLPVYNPQMTTGHPPLKGTFRNSKSENYGKYSSFTSERSKGGQTDRFPRSILRFDGILKNNLHPTQKPVALFEYLIKTYTNEGDLVLDNVAGSGTTGVAAQNLNRNFILMEQEPEYVEIIKKRLKLNKERHNDQSS